VVVTCSSSAFTNGGGSNNYYSLQSAASWGTFGQPGYVHRAIVSTITDATS
jgi:hypothetical protein